MRRICGALVALSTVACGGSEATPTDASAAGAPAVTQDASLDLGAYAPTSDAGSEADSPPDGGCLAGFTCPSTLPEAGAPCSGPSDQWQGCEYGDNPDPYFNTLATCVLGSWKVPPATDASAFAPLPAGCPATLAAAQSSATCQADAAAPGTILECYYPGGACMCGPPWSCVVAADGCPTPRPRIGSACTPPTRPDGGVIATCSYTPDFCGSPIPPTTDLSCTCGGRWVGGVRRPCISD
jgi:hypothetical protein